MKDLLARKLISQKKRLFRHFSATVYIDNGLKGTQFCFSADDAEIMQLPKMFPYRLRHLGQRDYHNGLVITPIEENQFGRVPYGVNEEYLALLQKNKNFFNPRIEPIVGIVVFGQYKGLMFSLFGTREIEEYFGRSSIQRVLRGERQFHRSCIFQHTTHREAIPFYGNLTKEVYDDLLRNKCLKSLERHAGIIR